MEGSGGSAMSSVLTALETALTSIQTDFMSAVGDILPIALAIMSVGIVVTLGVKFFKKIAHV